MALIFFLVSDQTFKEKQAMRTITIEVAPLVKTVGGYC